MSSRLLLHQKYPRHARRGPPTRDQRRQRPARKSEIKPRFRVMCEHLSKSIQRSRVGSFSEIDVSTSQAVFNVVWFEGNDAISHFSGFFILAHLRIGYYCTNENLYVSRIQLHCMLEVAHGIMPTALPAVDIASPFKNPCTVGQGTERDGELVTGSVVIEVAVVKVRS